MDCNRVFTFDKLEDWQWLEPELHVYPNRAADQDPVLYALKDELNEVKDRLSCYDILAWGKHTTSRDPAGKVVRHITESFRPRPFCTNAWCKFYEILSTQKIVQGLNLKKPLHSVHLCEAPGGFICALNHFIKLELHGLEHNWLASTLNPYHESNTYGEMIPDDRLIRLTYDHWVFGADNTGNITSERNVDALVGYVKAHLSHVQLVTADGSIDCQLRPGEQEVVVYPLLVAEVLSAVQMLSPWGCAVIKMFTFFEAGTASLLYALNIIFEQVTICKPVTSKPGNSEVYVICSRFLQVSSQIIKDLQSALDTGHPVLPLNTLPSSFRSQLRICVEKFKSLQEKTILENINTYGQSCHKDLMEKQAAFAEEFCTTVGLKPIHNNQSIGHEEYTVLHPRNRSLHEAASVSPYGPESSKARMWKPRKRRLSGNFAERCEMTKNKNWAAVLDKEDYCVEPVMYIFFVEAACPYQHTPAEVISDMRVVVCPSPAPARLVNSCFCDNQMLGDYVCLTQCPSSAVTDGSMCEGVCCHRDTETIEAALSALGDHELFGLECTPAQLAQSKSKHLVVVPFTDDLSQLSHLIKLLRPGDSVLLQNVTTLRRIGAGVVFLLWHMFDEVAVAAHSKCGLPSVLFKRCLLNPDSSALYDTFRAALCFVTPEHSVLELIPTPLILCCKPLYSFLCDMNNESLRRSTNRLRLILKASLCSGEQTSTTITSDVVVNSDSCY